MNPANSQHQHRGAAQKPARTPAEIHSPEATTAEPVSAQEPSSTLVPAETSAQTPAPAQSDQAPQPASQPKERKVVGSFAGGTWVALIVGALLLILLLVFILQNQQETELNLFAWTFVFPAGVGYLLAAITGALIMALVGGVRMLQLRRQVRNP